MKKLLLVSLVVIGALILAGCAAPAPAPAPSPEPAPAPKPSPAPSPAASPTPVAAQWNLKFHHHTTGKTAAVLEAWAKQIDDATIGRVKVNIFPGATLGKEKEAYELATTGTADISWGFLANFPGQFPMTDIGSLPLLGMPSGEVASRILWALYTKFQDAFAKEYKEVKVLTLHSSGTIPMATTKKPVRTLDDLKGLNIRIPGGPPTEMMKALGGNPVTVPTADLYSALEKGVIDGLCLGIMAMEDFKTYEVTKYFEETNFYATAFWLVMNKKTWDSMPPDVQQQIMSVSEEKGGIFLGKGWDALGISSANMIKKVPGKEFITYSPEEVARWRERAKPIWDAHIKNATAKGLPAQEALDYALKLIKEYSK